jgi:RNA polymerase primary sigma factor
MSKDFSSSVASIEQYLKEIGTYPLLDREEELKMARQAQKGDLKARQALVQSNLRLVVKIALEYVGLGLPLPDLVSEGNIGLVRASELFDPGREIKFSTYSALWIKQRIRRAITNQSKTVRVPIWKNQMLRRINISSNHLARELGRQPTEEELALDSGLSMKEIKNLQDGSVQVTSLDAPLGLGDDSELTMGSLLPDENTLIPGQSMHQDELLMETIASLDLLSDKELKIIALRFGLGGKAEQTLDSIGEGFRLSRERIRQLQEMALEKLRQQFKQPSHSLPEKKRRQVVKRVALRLRAIFRGQHQKLAYFSGIEPILSMAAARGY